MTNDHMKWQTCFVLKTHRICRLLKIATRSTLAFSEEALLARMLHTVGGLTGWRSGLNELLEKWTPDPITWVFWGVIHMASGDIRWPGENFTVCQVVGEVFLVQEALPTHWRSWGPCGKGAAKCSCWEGFAKINAFPLGSKLEFKRVVPITLWAGNLLDDEDQFWSRNGRYSPQHREVLLMQPSKGRAVVHRTPSGSQESTKARLAVLISRESV